MKRGDANLIGGRERPGLGDRRSLDQYNLNSQFASGRDFSVASRTATVFGNDGIDLVIPQQNEVVGLGERSTVQNIARVRHGQRWIDGFDRAHQITMPRRSVSGMSFLPTEREKDAARVRSECDDSIGGIGGVRPSVADLKFPRRAAQRDQRYARLCARPGSIVRHDRGKGMGRVDQQVDMVFGQPACEAVSTPEAATDYRHRHGNRGAGATGQRQSHRNVGSRGEFAGQQSRFGRAAQYEDRSHG